MTRAEYEKALELIRDNRDNVIEIAIGLNKMVTDDGGKAEEPTKTEAKAEVKESQAEVKSKSKPKYKPKKCISCGEVFQPKTNRQMRCDKCKTLTVEQDIKNTAAELAAMSESRK